MVDLSEGGAALDDGETRPIASSARSTGSAPHAGALVSIEATLLGQPFHAFATVRWSTSGGRMGVEFHDLEPEMLKRVRLFIDHVIATSETDARPAVATTSVVAIKPTDGASDA